MAKRIIVKVPDPILAKKCREVDKFDERLWTLLDDMKDTVKAANGAGLAAPRRNHRDPGDGGSASGGAQKSVRCRHRRRIFRTYQSRYHLAKRRTNGA